MQQNALEKHMAPVTRTEQKAGSLVNVIENLTVRDSAGETKKSSKAQHIKSKAERPRGRTPVVNVMRELFLAII